MILREYFAYKTVAAAPLTPPYTLLSKQRPSKSQDIFYFNRL